MNTMGLKKVARRRSLRSTDDDIVDPDDYYEVGGEPINRLLIYGVPFDVDTDTLAAISGQYGNVVKCSKLNGSRSKSRALVL